MASLDMPDATRRVMRLYNLLLPFALLFMLPGALIRMLRRGGWQGSFGMRMGRLPPDLLAWAKTRRPLWLHSVSVGETRMALRLLDALREREPGLPIVLSVTTSTAAQLVQPRLDEMTRMIFNPVDLPAALHPVFQALQPRALIAVEACWPNLFSIARSRQIPLVWIPRVSPRSRKRYDRWREYAHVVFSLPDRIACGFEEEATWFRSLGVPAAQTWCSGSLKFDLSPEAEPTENAPQDLLHKLGWDPEIECIVIGGSTFPGEEAALLRACRTAFVNQAWRLILVPRHVERRAGISTMLENEKETWTLRSQPASDANPRILLVDTTGELSAWYRCAQVAFVGKSLLSTGGQNPVEPALAGCHVITGPDMSNFASITAELENIGALTRIISEATLAETLASLSHSPAPDPTRVTELLSAHRGAATRIAEATLKRIAAL